MSVYQKRNFMSPEAEWKDLLIWYLNSEQETVLELEDALFKEDFERLIILGDQIYGHGGSLGLARISFLGKKIESAAIEKNTILLTVFIASFKAYLKYFLNKVERERLSLAS
jgi:HPt (histidine-containing phosphotransfer) domain-containing protein